jgi:hypothetical protein
LGSDTDGVGDWKRGLHAWKRQKKAIDGAGMRRCVTPFVVLQEKTHGKDGLFVVRREKTHGKDALFTMRRGPKRTAINGTFVVRPYKRTTKALFLLLVLVTLSRVFQKTHDKVASAIYFFVSHV